MAPIRGTRKYCFTYFGLVQTDDSYEASLLQVDSITFFVFQREKCPTTDRVHLQGYIELEKRKRIKTVARLLRVTFDGTGVTMLPAYGSSEENITYCTDPDKRVAGSISHTGGTPSQVCLFIIKLFPNSCSPLHLHSNQRIQTFYYG